MRPSEFLLHFDFMILKELLKYSTSSSFLNEIYQHSVCVLLILFALPAFSITLCLYVIVQK